MANEPSMVRRHSRLSDGGIMDRRHSQPKIRRGPLPQVVVRNFIAEVEPNILRAWLKIFDPEYRFHITSDQFCMGMERAGYAGDVYLLFQRLDTDNSGKLTLDEIDEDAAKLWLTFKQWCVASFESPLDMVYRLSRGKDYLSEEDFKLRCRLFDWKDGQEEWLWKGVALHNEEYVRPEMLKWMALGKEEHREKEELKKLAMKVHAVKIRERQMLAQALPQFKAYLKRKCGGSLLAAWRRHLDRHASMSVHKYEMAKAVKALCWPGEFRILWKALDKDKSGLVSYQELDMQGAEVLAEFKSFITAEFGTAEDAFHAMDKAKNNSGRLSERDFIEECQRHGFTASRALFRGLDFHATGSITRDEILFLDHWVCPSYLTAPKNEAAAQEFKHRLKKQYKSCLKAWRTCLDKDNSNRVTWERFQEGANRVFHTDLPGAWRYLTAGSTFLTLHDIDPETANRISHFQAFADEQFGSMMCAFKLFDLDRNGYVDVTEFTRVLIGFGYPGGQCKALFYCLDVDGHGRLSRRNVAFIDDWARPGEETCEEELSDKADEKKTTQKEKEVELSPRMLELTVPKKPRPDRLNSLRYVDTLEVRLAETDPNSYVPILLEMEEGKAYQIEARPKDTVKTLKAVLNLELGFAEQAIQLSFDGKVLSDEMELTEVDLKEGSKLQMEVVEVTEEAVSSSSGEGDGIRIFIKVDSAGKTTKLTLNLDPEEGIEDVKLEAYEQFRDKVPFLCDSPPKEYGLFLLDGTPVADSRGNLRWLKKSERLKETQTVAENGLEGGEELVFANLMWLDLGS